MTGVLNAVHHVGVVALVIAGGVVARGVHHHRGMVARRASVEPGVGGVTVGLVRVGRLPIVLIEMGLGEKDQHARVVGGAQGFREAHVGTRLTAVVVGIDGIETAAFRRSKVSREAV